MNDLYAKLNIEPDASQESIAAAVESQPELREYTATLLDPDRRADYDRVRALLNTIAELRFRLDLPTNDAWFRKHYPDFARWRDPRKRSREKEADLPQAVSPAARMYVNRSGRGMAPELVTILGALIVAGAVALYLLKG